MERIVFSVTMADRLKSEVLKTALKSFVVPNIVNSYQVCAIRALWYNEDAPSLIWGKRAQLENIISSVQNVVGFFSCVTALNGKNENGESIYEPGFSLWIMFDTPEVGIGNFENLLCRKLLASDLHIQKCTTIKGRGKKFKHCYKLHNLCKF